MSDQIIYKKRIDNEYMNYSYTLTIRKDELEINLKTNDRFMNLQNEVYPRYLYSYGKFIIYSGKLKYNIASFLSSRTGNINKIFHSKKEIEELITFILYDAKDIFTESKYFEVIFDRKTYLEFRTEPRFIKFCQSSSCFPTI